VASGSLNTAWSPPVIYSVTPDQWPAGATTTFTITGAGFGYSLNLTISGPGLIGYTSSCASISWATCDTQIVATVMLEANTPGGSVETIRVTANGQNPDGWLPVQIQGQSGQAMAQATTQAFVPPVPQIFFNGTNITNNGSPSCPGNVACVVVGQKIELTVQIPSGITPNSHRWTQPTGTVVGGFTPTPDSFQSGQDIPIPNSSEPCQSLGQVCLTFHWVTPSTANAPWQVGYSYTYNNQTSQTVTARFNVAGPTGLQVTGTTGVPDVFSNQQYGPSMGFTQLFNYGIDLTATATNPQAAPSGSFSWVQLITAERSFIRESGPSSGSGIVECTSSLLAQDLSPVLDNYYPTRTGSAFTDAPRRLGIGPAYEGDIASEVKLARSFLLYLMWNPTVPGSIPVPLGSVAWQWACDAVNTMTAQANGTTWTRVCAAPQTLSSVQFLAGASYPKWKSVIVNGETIRSCQYR
jgi:hypothetical protein